MDNINKKSIKLNIIKGGTGSGKTTKLNIISNFNPKERIITIEDNTELDLKENSNDDK